MDKVGPVYWEDREMLMHSRLEHVGEVEVGELEELTGVAELA